MVLHIRYRMAFPKRTAMTLTRTKDIQFQKPAQAIIHQHHRIGYQTMEAEYTMAVNIDQDHMIMLEMYDSPNFPK